MKKIIFFVGLFFLSAPLDAQNTPLGVYKVKIYFESQPNDFIISTFKALIKSAGTIEDADVFDKVYDFTYTPLYKEGDRKDDIHTSVLKIVNNLLKNKSGAENNKLDVDAAPKKGEITNRTFESYVVQDGVLVAKYKPELVRKQQECIDKAIKSGKKSSACAIL